MFPAVKWRVVWRSLALEDLTDAYLHIGTDSPAAAERWVDAVERTVQALATHPLAGRRLDFPGESERTLRLLAVRGFHAYLVVYGSWPGAIEVVRILHGARDLESELE